MAYSRVACVTGANKGIGYAIVRQIALQYPASQFNNGTLLIYLTARDKARGERAVKDITNDPLLKREKVLKEDGGLTSIEFHQVDISEEGSVRKFGEFLEKEHGKEGIDFVVNNAGIALEGFNSNVVRETLNCNYYGTFEAMRILLPLIHPNGRLVNVSSTAGMLHQFSPSIADRLRNAKSVGEVTSVMKDFQVAVDAGKENEAGFPSAAYATSKAGLTALTRVIAEEESKKGRGVLVNSCCPGYVNTSMTKGRGVKTIDEGAKTPVMLAIGKIGSKTGLFWRDEKVLNS